MWQQVLSETQAIKLPENLQGLSCGIIRESAYPITIWPAMEQTNCRVILVIELAPELT